MKDIIDIFGIEDNYRMINSYKEEIRKIIFKWLNRRSQRKSCSWERFERIEKMYPLARPHIYVTIRDR